MEPDIQVIIPRRGVNDEGKGKKFALVKLISSSNSEYVWMQDDDIVPPSACPPLEMVKKADLIILPLEMSRGKGSLIERLQQAEYAAIQQLTISSARYGHPVMCSGANLIARRERWLESVPDLHNEIPSGDDMFLLESFKRRGLNITVLDCPEYTATVSPLPTLQLLLRQRMRWAGKAPKYVDKDIRRCGFLVVLANFLQLLFPPFILVKFPIEYTIIKKRDASASFLVCFLLELLYPWYMFICLLGGLFRRVW